MTIFHNIREGFPLPLTPSHSSKLLADSQGRENKIDTSTAEFRLPYEYFLQKFTNAFRWPRHPLVATGQPVLGSDQQQTTPPNLFDITLVGLDRKTVPLRDFFNQGKIVVIVFWATWCHPCLLEITELNNIHNQYKDEVVIVSIAQQAPQAYYKDLANVAEKPNYLVFSDPSKEIYQTFFPHSQGSIPATVIYTSDGKIAFTDIGYTPNKTLKEIETLTTPSSLN